MAKSSKTKINKQLLSLIAAASASDSVFYVTQDEAKSAGLENNPQLIEVNTNMLQDNKAAARITEAGKNYLEPKSAEKMNIQTSGNEVASNFGLISGAVLPPSRRGTGLHGGAPKKYPFDQMEIGQSFFVPVSAQLPDPVKTLGSTVSSVNLRYAEKTGEMKEVTRAKRGPDRKALVENGQKVMETVQVPVHKFTRKYEIRGVEKGKQYGDWIAPETGALIARTQ